MAETKIEWADYTFNPWRGCTKVSAGCTHCYAETMSHRNPKVLGVWGDKGTRVIASETYWREPLKWDKATARGMTLWDLHVELCRQSGIADPTEEWKVRSDGESPPRRRRVFCASLAEVFEDRPELVAPRSRLFQLIAETQNLDWLLLTKRPENIERLWPRWADEQYSCLPNVWLGVSVENQKTSNERIPILLRTPAAVRFLSVEPLLEAVDLSRWLTGRNPLDGGCAVCGHPVRCRCEPAFPSVDWVIVGGESGPKARPCDVDWIRSVVRQCQQASVPVFVKQIGAEPYSLTGPPGTFLQGKQSLYSLGTAPMAKAMGLKLKPRDRKGGDPSEWPEDLQVREFPEVPKQLIHAKTSYDDDPNPLMLDDL